MMDVREFLARLWAAVVAVFFGAFVLSLANTAHARVFPECNPAAEAAKFYGAEDADAWVKRVCDAQEAAFQKWENSLQALDVGQQDLAMATNAGNWQAYRDKWAELLPVLKELEAAAQREAAASTLKSDTRHGQSREAPVPETQPPAPVARPAHAPVAPARVSSARLKESAELRRAKIALRARDHAYDPRADALGEIRPKRPPPPPPQNTPPGGGTPARH